MPRMQPFLFSTYAPPSLPACYRSSSKYCSTTIQATFCVCFTVRSSHESGQSAGKKKLLQISQAQTFCLLPPCMIPALFSMHGSTTTKADQVHCWSNYAYSSIIKYSITADCSCDAVSIDGRGWTFAHARYLPSILHNIAHSLL